jgi:hypothetical protein
MKMKKLVCIFILICVIMGAAFAQQKPATPAPAPAPAAAPSNKGNAIGMDLFQMVRGFIATDRDAEFSAFIIVTSYERLLGPHFSIGADLDIYFMTLGSGRQSVDGTYLSLAAEGRYYPASENLEKFFIGTTLGFNQLEIDGSKKPENGGFSGLITSLKIGYKVITKAGFFMEPSFAYVLSKSSGAGGFLALFGLPSIPTPNGWSGGLRLGWAV